MHSCGVRLHDGSPGINVDDQSGQVISFTMYETIGVIGRIDCDTDTAAHLVGDL